MSLNTPTTKEISDNIVAQLETSLNQTIPLIPKAFNRVLAKALAGVFVLLYKYGGFMFLQIFVRTASANPTNINGVSITPLTEWGRLIGVGDPAPAVHAELLVDITVENQSGFLPNNTQLLNADNGVTYVTIGAVELISEIVQARVRAASDQVGGAGAGALGNLQPGAALSLANPLANVSRNAVVSSQLVTGANAESVDLYRQRVIDRFQKRPQGGAYVDYELWGEEPAGIVNVYPYTSDCPGQVDLYVEATPESSGSPDGIPTNAQLQAVLDAVEFDVRDLASRRPANALANVFPIRRTAFRVRVSGLQVDDEATVRDQITAVIEDYFSEREPYIFGLSVPPRKDRITSSAIGGAVDDVVSGAGGIFSTVTVTVAGQPMTLHSLGIGEKAKVEAVEYP